jgi:undecaprenyl-diphosphatase
MGCGLLLTSFLLHSQKHRPQALKALGADRSYSHANWKDGLSTGLLQGLSTLPGVSRSGTTTTALLWCGFSPEAAFELSFMLSIPTVFLAEIILWSAQLLQSGVSLASIFSMFSPTDALLLILSSAFFGYLTIGALIRIAKHINFSVTAAVLGLMMLAVGLLSLG